ERGIQLALKNGGLLLRDPQGKLDPVLREQLAVHVPIGRPLPNTKLHVLDARGEVVPVGVVGGSTWAARVSRAVIGVARR
ncbi:MAG: hypothetical protein ABL934_19415, partial [Lysobacteraceae bacterium]